MRKKLIDKDALMAEIESIEYETNYEPFTDEVLGKRKVCKDIKDFLDTLEVKEVDLKRAIDKWIDDTAITHEDCSVADVISTAKHFFELGLKA